VGVGKDALQCGGVVRDFAGCRGLMNAWV